MFVSESVGLRGRLMRKIRTLKVEESGSGVPDEFLCPITTELMKDPVIAAGGEEPLHEGASLPAVVYVDSAPQTGTPMSETPSRPGSGARAGPAP